MLAAGEKLPQIVLADETGQVDGSVMDTLRGLPRATNSMSNQAKA